MRRPEDADDHGLASETIGPAAASHRERAAPRDRPRRREVIVRWILGGALTLVSTQAAFSRPHAASAQHAPTQPPADQTTVPALPHGPPAASEYVTLIRRAVARLAARDIGGAFDALRSAKRLDPMHGAAYYHAGELHRLQGQVDAALREYRTAARLAPDDYPGLKGRALMGIALVLEAAPDRFGEARQAWEAYLELARAHPDDCHPDTAYARLNAVTVVEQLRRADAVVRARIAARERVQRATK